MASEGSNEDVMFTRTTTALLDDLRDPENHLVWKAFDERYRPILVALARRSGLGTADAADAAQDALVRFVTAYHDGRYDPGRGRLGSWLVGIARHCIADVHGRRSRRREQRGLSGIPHLPGEAELEAIWDEECDREILRQAMDQLRSGTAVDARTIRAFELQAFHGHAAATVALDQTMTLNEVYLAKHRCLKRLRGIVEELRTAYDAT